MHLIVSNDKRTWQSDSEILFAGDWCLKNNQINIDNKYKIFSLDINGEKNRYNFESIDKNWEKIYTLKNLIFDQLCQHLNNHFKKKHSNRFYQIIIGHWFEYAVEIIFNKINLLDQILKKNNITSFNYINDKDYNLAVFSNHQFMNAHFDDMWNQRLFAEIIEKKGNDNIQITEISDTIKSKFEKPQKDKKGLKSLIKYSYKLINYLLDNISKNTDAFIISSYLPVKYELLLKLSLGQLPFISRKNTFNSTVSVNVDLRNELTKSFITEKDKQDSNIFTVKSLLFKLFPVTYLEAFDELENKVKNISWPKNPKFIFTSNSYFDDDIFKLWVAIKVKEGIKYFIGQHGPYGQLINVLKGRSYNSCEELTCDKFITLGRNNNYNNISGLNFNLPKSNIIKHNSKGKLLLINPPVAYFGYRRAWSDVFWSDLRPYHSWEKKIAKFIGKLNKNISQNLLIKLYSNIPQLEEFNEFWRNTFKQQQVISNNQTTFNLFKKSRLVVICYDSRAIIETMSQNIPTIILMEDFMIKQIRAENKKYYSRLHRTGILFDNYDKAMNFINENWNNIDEWWNSKKIQEERALFVDKFSRTKKDPINFLKKIFVSNM